MTTSDITLCYFSIIKKCKGLFLNFSITYPLIPYGVRGVRRVYLKLTVLSIGVHLIVFCAEDTTSQRSPDPCVEHLTASDQKLSKVLTLSTTSNSVTIKNTSLNSCVDNFELYDGKTKLHIGSINANHLLHDILDLGSESPKDDLSRLQRIWTWTSQGFKHLCSASVPNVAIKENESILSRIYSYSFGCCSDVNSPIQLALLSQAGFNVSSVASTHHESTEVTLPNNETYYVDSDLKLFLRGTHNDFPYLRTVLNSAQASDYAKTFLSSKNKDLGQFNLVLKPGDSLEFTQTPISTNKIIVSPYPQKIEDSSILKGTSLGKAHLFLDTFYKSFYNDGNDLCNHYSIQFPYALQSMTIQGTTSSYGYIYPINNDSDKPIKVESHLDGLIDFNIPSYNVDYLTNSEVKQVSDTWNYPWGQYNLKFDVCDVKKNSLSNVFIDLEFQYNNRIFPSQLDLIKIGNTSVNENIDLKKSVTTELLNQTASIPSISGIDNKGILTITDKAYTLKGHCVSEVHLMTTGGVYHLPCVDYAWSFETTLSFTGSPITIVSWDTDNIPVSKSAEISCPDCD